MANQNPVRNAVLLNAALFLFVLVVGLSAIEVVLRVRNLAMDNYDIEMWKYSRELKQRSDNPLLGHQHIPNSKATLQNVEIRINPHGLRGKDTEVERHTDRRIIFIGSSITLGWGVAEEDITTSRLQSFFEKDGQSVEVLNAGIGNYNTARQVELFFSQLKKFQPTDIVVQHFINDAEELDAGGGNIFLRHSQLAVMIWIIGNRILSPGGEDLLLQHYRSVYEKDARGYQAMRDALKKLSVYANKNNIKIHLALVPEFHNLTDYPFDFIQRQMKKLGQDLGYNTVDLLPALRNIPRDKIWVMPGDPHANSYGHSLMAETIYQAIR